MDKEKITIDKLYSNQLENFDKHENSDIEKYQTKINDYYSKIAEVDNMDKISEYEKKNISIRKKD